MAAAAGCAAQPACRTGAPQTVATLLFGGDMGGQAIADAEWRAFADREITPRFPDGLTILRGDGQWRGAGGAAVREPAWIVIVAAPDEPATMQKLSDIRRAYTTAFRQESVGLLLSAACVSF